jgi:hypothetical protein
MPSAGYETAIPAIKRLQNYASDRTATGIDQLMLYGEVIAVCHEIHTKLVNTMCGQNAEFLNVKPSSTQDKQ